jgi:hypothetical protein
MISELDIRKINGRGEPDYCVPFYTAPNGKAVALREFHGNSEPQRFTLEGARREIMLVRKGVRWWNFPANCIVRVYLK